MLSLLRVMADPTLKSSPPSPPPPHQLKPYPSVGERRAICPVVTDARNLQVVQATSVGHPHEVAPTTTDSQQSHSSIPSLLYPDISNDTGDHSTMISDTSLDSDANCCAAATTPIVHTPCSCFPVLGPFDILHCLQSGGYGTAWAAKDQGTGRLLCLKAFDSLESTNITRSVKMELRIFRRMAKSKSGERGKQFLIELNRSIQQGQYVFFAMELMTIDLDMYMSTQPERCKLHACRWMAQMALGIQSLHDMGIIHRDIKPENVLIDSRENVRIIDFGLCYLHPTGRPLRQGSGYVTDFLGTVPYMAPEVLRNKDLPTDRREYYGIAVDWWALGCLLFELESPGHEPLFDSAEHAHPCIARTQWSFPPGPPYATIEGLDPVVMDLLKGLLRVQPAIRFSLGDMKKHVYFLHRDGTSEFDNATARALDRPVRPELVPQFTDDDRPISKVEVAGLDSIFDWANHKWACLKDVRNTDEMV